MVDTALFVGMSGETQTLRTMQIVSNNLSNSGTIGFQADYEAMKPFATNKERLQTRVYSDVGEMYTEFKPGPRIKTDEALDIAIVGKGFIAVQTPVGNEAYTRAGNFQIREDGILMTGHGDMVLSDKGLVSIPRGARVSIDQYGSVSAVLPGKAATENVSLGRIKLVDVAIKDLQKREDGLLYLSTPGVTLSAAETVRVQSGMLEGSNVDTVDALTDIISASRQLEMHTQLVKTMADNATQANQLINAVETA